MAPVVVGGSRGVTSIADAGAALECGPAREKVVMVVTSPVVASAVGTATAPMLDVEEPGAPSSSASDVGT